MSISFRCNNPDCRQSVNAPDGTGGRKARCPACGTIQVIPTPPSDPLPLQDDDPPAPGIVCGECGNALPPNAMLCSRCGWVNPSAYGTPPTPTPPAAVEESGSMAVDCLKALGYGFSNLGSLAKLVLYSIGLGIAVGMIRSFFDWLMFMGPVGYAIVVVVSILGEIVISGYFFRFYLDCAISSLEGVNQAPGVPDLDLKTLLLTGFQGVGVMFVYFLPVVTIPLLPLGLLAWAYSDDARMFDLRWALRAAAKKPGRLVTLWVIMLLWGVVGVVMLVCVWLLLVAVGGILLIGVKSIFNWFLMILLLIMIGGFFLSVVFHTFMAVQFRCVGMLGRYNPDLLEMLPEETTISYSVGAIIGGIVLSGILWGTVAFHLLHP
jgi:hypothetical protein